MAAEIYIDTNDDETEATLTRDAFGGAMVDGVTGACGVECRDFDTVAEARDYLADNGYEWAYTA